MSPIENGTDGFDKRLPTGFTLITLCSGWGAAKLADVARLKLSVLTTGRVPAEAAGHNKVLLVHSRAPHSACYGQNAINTQGVDYLLVKVLAERIEHPREIADQQVFFVQVVGIKRRAADVGTVDNVFVMSS